MRRYAIAAVFAALLVSTLAAPGARHASAAAQAAQAKVQEILADQALWGPDFPELLAAMKDLGESGETKIEVFATEAVGETRLPDLISARARARRLHNLMRDSIQQNFKAEFENRIHRKANEEIQDVVPTVHTSKDDQSPRVVLLNKDSVRPGYLAAGLTMATVEARQGPPEQVTEMVIDTGDERRPIVLTLHSYAGGAIAFAESDVAPRGKVERVILDTAKISNAIFRR